jgi:2-polyprenyl-3-methyl-5-hydroxy-6-metoxy-1,4-benzoquinol methylase
MIEQFITHFEYRGMNAAIKDNALQFGRHTVAVRNGIPRFTPDQTYTSGNFSRLREKHPRLQLDSYNMTTDRYQTILERTNWPSSFFKGKTVLECGCGVGPDSEILLSLGASVLAVDLTNLDTARDNLGSGDNLCLVQADVTDLPLRKKTFDIVFCHRVLQHTPEPEYTLRHILQFVKDEGAVFIHSYARTWYQLCTWKYLLRPITSKMDGQKLYDWIRCCAPAAFALTTAVSRLPKGHLINHFFIPFRNHRNHPRLRVLSDRQLIEYGVHDTYDSLSPRYDRPLSAAVMKKTAGAILHRPWEVVESPTVTLLRTVIRVTERRGDRGN